MRNYAIGKANCGLSAAQLADNEALHGAARDVEPVAVAFGRHRDKIRGVGIDDVAELRIKRHTGDAVRQGGLAVVFDRRLGLDRCIFTDTTHASPTYNAAAAARAVGVELPVEMHVAAIVELKHSDVVAVADVEFQAACIGSTAEELEQRRLVAVRAVYLIRIGTDR